MPISERTRKIRFALGYCPTCRCRIPRLGRKTCDVCIERAVERRRTWRRGGLCVDCREPTGGSRRCYLCDRANKEANLARRAQRE